MRNDKILYALFVFRKTYVLWWKENYIDEPIQKIDNMWKSTFYWKESKQTWITIFTERKDTLNFVIEENLNWNTKNVWKSWKLLTHRQIQIEWKVAFLQFLNFSLRNVKVFWSFLLFLIWMKRNEAFHYPPISN